MYRIEKSDANGKVTRIFRVNDASSLAFIVRYNIFMAFYFNNV